MRLVKNINLIFLGFLAVLSLTAAGLTQLPEFAGFLTFGFVLTAWMISLCLHEWAHAYAAYQFGDYTVVDQGYLTLDPRKYVDTVSTFILPLIVIAIGGIGFPGGAVMIHTGLIKKAWQRSMVAFAGPLMTFVLALGAFLASKYLGRTLLGDAFAVTGLYLMIAFVLNMLPLPGFDGLAVLTPFLPADVRQKIDNLSQLGRVNIIVMFLIFFFGMRIIMPIVAIIAYFTGLNLDPAFDGWARFHFWQ